MDKIRYEVELQKMKDGRVQAIIHDDYWDSMWSEFFNPEHPEKAERKQSGKPMIQKLANQFKGRTSGWVAIEVESYPWGNPTKVIDIPGRNKRYINNGR